MNNQCSTCQKHFPSLKALQCHTGTEDLISASSHLCSDCGRQFCSENALHQHKNSPSHASIFKCSKCNKPFRSKQAVQQHETATGHTRDSHIGASSNVFSSPAKKSPTQQRKSSNVKTVERWKVDAETVLMMGMGQHQDWALCDKDCGWCGHCAGKYGY